MASQQPVSRTASCCAYCGGPNETRDHVPTRKLFPIPRPADLITVPSCLPCNNHLSPEEEEFVHVILSLRESDSPAARQLREQLFSKERTPRRIRMALRMLRTIKRAPVRTPAGLYVGVAPTFEIDLGAFDKVVEKIARGLWFAEFQEPLSLDRVAQVVLNPQPSDPEWEIVEAAFQDGRGRDIGPGVFEYWIGRAQDAADTGACVMSFFGATLVLCTLVRPELLQAVPHPDSQSPP